MNNRYLRDISSKPSTDVDNAVETGAATAVGTGTTTAVEIGTATAVETATAKVILLPTAKAKPDPFQQLTVELVLAQFRADTLPEAMLLYPLAGAGLAMRSPFSLGGVDGSLQIGTDGSQQIGTDGSLQILELAGREEWALSHLVAVGDGQFAGTHGRYILRSKVECLGAKALAT